MTDQRRLAAYFAELSEELLSTTEEPLTFQKVVHRAVEVIPGCDHAGITLRKRRGRAETVAASDEVVEVLDSLQYQLGEGPCIDAAFDQVEYVVIDDARTEDRWSTWCAGAAERGLRAAMAIRLHTDSETLGALNLYAATPAAFDEEARLVATIFASHAADAMNTARLVTGLRAALESRHTIGIAQGVLAVRYDVSFERAFQLLHRLSNDHNIKLRDLAQEVLDERGLPERLGAEERGAPERSLSAGPEAIAD